MDVIARGADQSRTKLDLLVAGRVDESVLVIRDGNRALMYDPDAKTPSYELMEAADEHPEDLPWESSPLDPDSDDFQTRWEAIQVRFVDEPRGAVEDADALVANVMQRLAEGFAQERERLEGQWGRGEDISTEDLRVALQRYRSFFQRLLAT